MDKLTFYTLAQVQPRRAFIYRPPSMVGTSVECARCAMSFVVTGDKHQGWIADIIKYTHLSLVNKINPCDWPICVTCGEPLEWEDTWTP